MAGDHRASGLFCERELAVIEWAESVALNTARQNRVAFEALRRHFSDPEIVELTVVVAHRTMINRIQEALWTDLEGPEIPKNTRAEILGDVLGRYVGEVLIPLSSNLGSGE